MNVVSANAHEYDYSGLYNMIARKCPATDRCGGGAAQLIQADIMSAVTAGTHDV